MNKVYVASFTEKKLKRGIQLLEEKDFSHLEIEDQLVELYSQKKQFLGTAYLSRQQKGVGWFLSRDKHPLDFAYFSSLFRQARAKRHSFEMNQETTAYRLFNQDGDNFGGLTIDRYGDYVLFSWYNRFVYAQKDLILSAFQSVYPDVKGAYGKIRFKGVSTDLSAHLYGEQAPDYFSILENGVRYQVFLNDGLMTGIFLDQHEVRASLIDGLAAGKSVLNMFSYTAAFSVAAAMGGALETTSVDLAKRSRELSLAHFQANSLPTDSHQFVVMDVFAYFKYAKRKGLSFDVIVLDPPSFARNKKQTFSVVKDYHRLIADALPILSDDGVIIASTNAANLTVAQFKKEIEKGFGDTAHDYINFKQLPSDFAVNDCDSSSNYLKVWTIKVRK